MAQPIGQPEPAPASSDSAIVYYDGWCNACIKAANLFTKLDKDRQLVQCVDFRKTDDPRLDLIDRDQSELASTLHVRSPNGSITSGPEAIRSV
ncbi:MAG: DUF393 domain-containing protein, partial [Phycisphaerales bacterium]|nr:DUF393 domain-containing protein [Phycisphaerales bacterium]